MCQKQLRESDTSKKDASQWPPSLLKGSFFQNGFLLHLPGLALMG